MKVPRRGRVLVLVCVRVTQRCRRQGGAGGGVVAGRPAGLRRGRAVWRRQPVVVMVGGVLVFFARGRLAVPSRFLAYRRFFASSAPHLPPLTDQPY